MARKAASNPFIKANDFRNVPHRVRVENTTTLTRVKNEAAIRLCEILERGLVVEMPAKSCSDGHFLLIEVFADDTDTAQGPEAKPLFAATARVSGVEPLKKDMVSVTLEIYQLQETAWKKFRHVFVERQKVITDLITKIKG